MNAILSTPFYLEIREIQARVGEVTCSVSQRGSRAKSVSGKRLCELSVAFMLCCLCPDDEPEGINCVPAATRENLHGAKDFTRSADHRLPC